MAAILSMAFRLIWRKSPCVANPEQWLGAPDAAPLMLASPSRAEQSPHRRLVPVAVGSGEMAPYR